MKIVIFEEDEKEALKLKNLITESCNYLKVDFDIRVCQGLECVENNIDIDIYKTFFISLKNDLKGFEIAKKLTELNPQIIINFISSNHELVFDSFNYRPFSFIRKEYLEEEIHKVLQDVKFRIYRQRAITTVNSNGKIILLDLFSVCYAEVFKNDLYLQTEHDRIRIRRTISQGEEEWRGLGFIRVHLSYLVNCKYIKEYNSKSLILFDGTEIPISRSRTKDVQKYITEYQTRRTRYL